MARMTSSEGWSSSRSNGGGGITSDTRWSSDSGSPMWKSAPSGAGHLGGEPGPDGGAGDPTHHLADQVALGDGVVARRGARLPPRLLGGQQRGALLPVGQVLGPHRLGPARAGRRCGAIRWRTSTCSLPPAANSGQYRATGRVEVELAPVGQHQGAQEGHGLGGRPDVGDGVLLPRAPSAGLVDRAAPDVHHRLAVQEHGHRGADVGAGVEAGGEVVATPSNLGSQVPGCRPSSSLPFGSLPPIIPRGPSNRHPPAGPDQRIEARHRARAGSVGAVSSSDGEGDRHRGERSDRFGQPDRPGRRGGPRRPRPPSGGHRRGRVRWHRPGRPAPGRGRRRRGPPRAGG